ncbi:uncharacterized protein LOC110022607 [Phalaenopsis equestris]|uniref:uncharacterized protein LOC110022607 n=1 Tax=Phalaenopsis equestris TaxID=78828 RepID=UPI0009E4E65F|nr:uncharacterized protein LOC110022607 [Phalaenopsis equestris]
MMEGVLPTLLSSFQSWFTPTILFLLLNLIIGTIALTSKSSRTEDAPLHPPPPNETITSKFSRSSSALLHRILSFNPHLHSPSPTDIKPLDPPSLETDSIKPDPALTGEIHHHLNRIQSPAETDSKLAERMKKSATEKPPHAHFEEGEILQLADSIVGEDGREVDALADDFIYRFRQQLKLQRLESVVRYETMLSRGQSK